MNFRFEIYLLIALPFIFGGCANCPSRPYQHPEYEAPVAQKIVARVSGMTSVGAHVDFEDGSSSTAHSIDFTVLRPEGYAYNRLHILFSGLPVVGGRRIELGDKLEFTVPARTGGTMDWVYLDQLVDMIWID